MPRPKRWVERSLGNGIQQVDIVAWKYFADYVTAELLDYPTFIYRGHASAGWLLEPSLDRILRTRGRVASTSLRARHLENFKLACRGRRGSNPVRIELENEWWALGQHQGLATPLLDWTQSPYVAAYFAYEQVRPASTERIAVIAIDTALIEERSAAIARAYRGPDRAPIVEFIRPMQDENARLVSQGGLFSRAPDGVDLEAWLRTSMPEDYDSVVMIKITLPSDDRLLALRSLQRMNINGASLFPDLTGASTFCNMSLQIGRYS